VSSIFFRATPVLSAPRLLTASARADEGEEGKRLRAEAQKCYDERSRCFDEKQAAFDAGDKDNGHALQKEANEWGEKAKAASQAAAEAILAFNNDGKGDMFIDFHGLKVDEAVGFLRARLEAVGASPDGEREMEVMPGAGTHSGAGGAKIKPECAKVLTELGLKFEDKTAGSWTVMV
jgi:DNA-nicking Smr family endonuclease